MPDACKHLFTADMHLNNGLFDMIGMPAPLCTTQRGEAPCFEYEPAAAELRFSSESHHRPDIFGRQQDEDQADEQDRRPGPLELTVFTIVEVTHSQLDKERDCKHHA